MSDAQHYRRIADALARHGFGALIGTAGMQRWVPLHHGFLGHERREQPYSTPEHLRVELGALGPTFVKLGQVLSTRPDLLSATYRQELVALQDDATPVAATQISEVIHCELGGPPSAGFASFDLEPLASASLGQAHAATLHDGTEVVVKVRRPRVVEQVEEDLEPLRNVAARVSWLEATGRRLAWAVILAAVIRTRADLGWHRRAHPTPPDLRTQVMAHAQYRGRPRRPGGGYQYGGATRCSSRGAEVVTTRVGRNMMLGSRQTRAGSPPAAAGEASR